MHPLIDGAEKQPPASIPTSTSAPTSTSTQTSTQTQGGRAYSRLLPPAPITQTRIPTNTNTNIVTLNGPILDLTADSQPDRAAYLLACGMSLKDAAVASGVSIRTIKEWSKRKEFRDHVQQHYNEQGDALSNFLVSKEARVQRLSDRLTELDTIIAERAMRAQNDPTAPPEAHTGLMAEITIMSPQGHTITSWQFDESIARELRAIEKQMAQELGQLDVKSVQLNVKTYVGIDINRV